MCNFASKSLYFAIDYYHGEYWLKMYFGIQSNGVFYFMRRADFRCEKMTTINGLNEIASMKRYRARSVHSNECVRRTTLTHFFLSKATHMYDLFTNHIESNKSHTQKLKACYFVTLRTHR